MNVLENNIPKPENIVDILQQRIKEGKVRAFANDNVSDIFESDLEREELITEVAVRFEEVLRGLLIDVDNDPNSKGTARRLSKMYINELMSGRFYDAPTVTAFPNDGSHGTARYDGMIVVRAEINSICSHHWQPVTGIAFIGVIPITNVIGLSKYSRIAHHCARRGTLQEELCTDIANAISTASKTEDVAVYIESEHGCCTNRGIMAHSSLTQTTVLRGQFHDSSVKKEFFDNIQLQKMHSGIGR